MLANKHTQFHYIPCSCQLLLRGECEWTMSPHACCAQLNQPPVAAHLMIDAIAPAIGGSATPTRACALLCRYPGGSCRFRSSRAAASALVKSAASARGGRDGGLGEARRRAVVCSIGSAAGGLKCMRICEEKQSAFETLFSSHAHLAAAARVHACMHSCMHATAPHAHGKRHSRGL